MSTRTTRRRKTTLTLGHLAMTASMSLVVGLGLGLHASGALLPFLSALGHLALTLALAYLSIRVAWAVFAILLAGIRGAIAQYLINKEIGWKK
jgi:hypothetical protein